MTKAEAFEIAGRGILFGRQGEALNVPGKMMHGASALLDGAGGGKDDGTSGSKGQAHQALAGDFETGQAVGRDLDDAPCAGERGRDVEIAIHVEGQSLRSSQPLVEGGHGSVGIDLVNAVRGPGDEQVAMVIERQVISRYAGFERGKDEDLLDGRNLEDGAVTVADVETLLAIKCDTSGHAHA